MGTSSGSKKARTFEGLVLQQGCFDDFKDDSRLNRRLRRKLNVLAANQNSKRKSSGNAPGRTRVKNKMHVEEVTSAGGVRNTIRAEEIISLDDVCDEDDENDSDYVAYLTEGVRSSTDAATSVQEVSDDVDGDSNEDDSDYVNYLKYLTEGEKSCNDARSVDEIGDDGHDCDSSYEECLRNLLGDGKSQSDGRSVGDVHDDVDPDYKVFLENVKNDENSYVLEAFVGGEILDPIMYEKDSGPQDMLYLETEKTLKSCSVNGKTRVQRSLSGISGRENMRITNSIEDCENPRTLKEALEASNEVVRRRRAVKRNANKKCSGPVSIRMQGFSNMTSGSKATCSAKQDSTGNAESDGEISYLKYLNGHTIDCEVVSVGPSDNPLIVDEDEKSDSDLKVIAMDKDPYCNEGYTPFVSARPFHERIEADDWTCDGSLTTSHSQFREKLMEILKRPYDSNECKNLLKEASCRKPIVRDRTLRSVTKSYKSDSIAQSYLDWCTDLAEKIDLARGDQLRTLNLLRGFFYWLKNLSQEGAFRPWLDPICSEVLPPLESPVDDNATVESEE
ncbi:uncharacterized protein LOC107421105 isoform X2 [Ziziphus jujuba]|uniref:Uncharacterized protein LOC107421105 isoform X2 n=1 Tax=Ziziphus jujuba TaxID=326968 RepID=A0A6P3ZYN7_ZIZJJ|nr:uncharacterized protein LOC107421105 isoform X2 [Ziziphus jujuba]